MIFVYAFLILAKVTRASQDNVARNKASSSTKAEIPPLANPDLFSSSSQPTVSFNNLQHEANAEADLRALINNRAIDYYGSMLHEDVPLRERNGKILRKPDFLDHDEDNFDTEKEDSEEEEEKDSEVEREGSEEEEEKDYDVEREDFEEEDEKDSEEEEESSCEEMESKEDEDKEQSEKDEDEEEHEERDNEEMKDEEEMELEDEEKEYEKDRDGEEHEERHNEEKEHAEENLLNEVLQDKQQDNNMNYRGEDKSNPLKKTETKAECIVHNYDNSVNRVKNVGQEKETEGTGLTDQAVNTNNDQSKAHQLTNADPAKESEQSNHPAPPSGKFFCFFVRWSWLVLLGYPFS